MSQHQHKQDPHPPMPQSKSMDLSMQGMMEGRAEGNLGSEHMKPHQKGTDKVCSAPPDSHLVLYDDMQHCAVCSPGPRAR
jgi:hypothetical protein